MRRSWRAWSPLLLRWLNKVIRMNNESNPANKLLILPRILLGLFFLSGIAGLMYEVIWVQQLTLVLGASTYAVTVVLISFMLGLAIGAWLIGNLVDRLTEHNLLGVYVLLEIAIGAYSLLFPFLLGLAEGQLVSFYQAYQPGPFLFNSIKLLLALGLLIVPTTLIGATLPVLAKYVVRERKNISLRVSQLYAANTLGALTGVVVTGYFFLPLLGVIKTTWLAVGANFSIAAGFWLVRVLAAAGMQPANQPVRSAASDSDGLIMTLQQKAVLISFALSGVAAMFYEVAWTRTLCMILGTTTYAFTTMLATFLVGIALGSWIYALIPRAISRLKLFIMLQILIVFSVLLSIPVFEQLPLLYLSLHQLWVSSWLDLQFLRFALAMLVMLLPALALGSLFPVVSDIFITQTSHLGRRLGKVYAFNTLGSALGAGLGGLILVPLVGMQKTIMLGVLLNFMAGFIVHFAQEHRSLRQLAWRPLAVGLAALLLVWSIKPWAPRIMNSGTYVYAQNYQGMLARYHEASLVNEDVETLSDWKVWKMAMQQYELLYYRTGVTATVGVMERDDGVRFLTINGKTDASTGVKSDMRTQVMIGQLPLLFHPDPDEVLLVGLGSGITVGSMLTHDIRVVDCAEISPAVMEAARYFDEANHHAMEDERLRIYAQDARNMLLTSEKNYDVIVSQPSNPWISGESSLFTQEWYSLVRDHLRTDGLFLQWVPAYLISERDVKTIAHTLRSVFPNSTVWSSGSVGDLIFMAQKDGAMQIDYPLFRARIEKPAVRQDIARLGLDPLLLPLELFVMDEQELSAYLYAGLGRPLRMNTDDLMITEYSTPKQLIRRDTASRFVDRGQPHGDLDRLLPIFTNIDEAELLELLEERIKKRAAPAAPSSAPAGMVL